MKRVLLFTLEYPPDRGGVASYLGALHEGLPNVIVARPSFWSLWPQWLIMIWQLACTVRRERIELVAISHVLPVGYAALIVQRLLGVPYVVFVHGLDVLRAARTPWKRFWLKQILRAADHVIANSQFTQRLSLEHGARLGRTTVITPCLREPLPPSPTPREGERKRGWTLLSVGRLMPRKNHRAVLEVLQGLREDFPEIQYVIIGEGPLRAELEREVWERGLTDAVQFLGAVADEERAACYERADIFVLPTYSEGDDVEGFGLVFLEAASYGLPVIAGRGGGVDEAVQDHETGFLVDPHDRQALATAVRTLLTDPAAAASMGQRGRERVAREYMCNDRHAKLANIYKLGSRF